MKRIGLYLMTNLGVLLVFSFLFKVLGLEKLLLQLGIPANMTGSLIMCAMIGFAGSLVSLFMSKSMAKRSSRTQIITQPQNADEQWLIDTVEELAQKAGIDMPEVGIFPSQQANAFATGWNKNAALVAVSEGLLHRFNRNQTRAVLAHEIGHVANGDMVTLSLMQGVVNTFVLFFARIIGQFVDQAIFKNERGRGMGYFVSRMAAEMALGVLTSVIVMWFSRYREYRADEAGATLADKEDMISALQQLRAEYEQPSDLPSEMSAFGLKGGKKALFASHPPLDQRIQALEKLSV